MFRLAIIFSLTFAWGMPPLEILRPQALDLPLKRFHFGVVQTVVVAHTEGLRLALALRQPIAEKAEMVRAEIWD
jgi:hypothetical protein